jgi:hypothetical protein
MRKRPEEASMRMDKHITLLGALFIAYHVIGLLVGFVIMTALSTIGCLSGDPLAITVLSTIGVGIGMFLIVLSIPGLVAGIWLLMRRPWARILALIVGAFQLIDVPLGTALGIYAFWVLLNDDTIAIFNGSASTAPAVPASGAGAQTE